MCVYNTCSLSLSLSNMFEFKINFVWKGYKLIELHLKPFMHVVRYVVLYFSVFNIKYKHIL